MKTVIQLILFAAIVALSFFIYKSIEEPITFNKEKKRRYDSVIERLKDIRTAQIAYKSVYNKYTPSFDTLINFVLTDTFNVIKAEGSIPDSIYNNASSVKEAEKIALEAGIIKRDTVPVRVLDSLFKKSERPKFSIENIRYIPFTDNMQFKMGADEIMTGSNVKVKVFEAKAPNHVILNGLEEQLIINLNEECEKLNKYKGLKVGSLEEATNNAGNWE